MTIYCPKCHRISYCPCAACTKRHPERGPLTIQKENDGLACAHCGYEMHADEWFDLEYKQATSLTRVIELQERIAALEGILSDCPVGYTKAGAGHIITCWRRGVSPEKFAAWVDRKEAILHGAQDAKKKRGRRWQKK